jgi:hypothetical protein
MIVTIRDKDDAILGQKDVTGTAWRCTDEGFANMSEIRIPITTPGTVEHEVSVSDAGRQLHGKTQLGRATGVAMKAGQTLSIAPGSITITWIYHGER